MTVTKSALLRRLEFVLAVLCGALTLLPTPARWIVFGLFLCLEVVRTIVRYESEDASAAEVEAIGARHNVRRRYLESQWAYQQRLLRRLAGAP